MKIALYYPWIYLTSGAERTILEVSRRSRHDWTLFTSHFDPGQTFPGLAEQHVVVKGRVSVDRSLSAVALAALQIVGLRLPMKDYDALVVVCEGLGDLILFRNSERPALCICLTPLRLAFDEHYQQRAFQNRGPLARAVIRVGSSLFRVIDRFAWKRYSRVFCISQEAYRRALAGGLGKKEDLEILHVGLGFDPTSVSPAEPNRYFLLPGRIMWTKNIELGIEAFFRFRGSAPEFSDYRLIIAGVVDQKSKPYLEKLQQLAGSDPGVEFKFLPTDAELADLYARCQAVLFTAFNEDWGIVPLEGMAFGKPVIAVNRGGPRESVEHTVQGFLEEPEPADFAARMIELAQKPELAKEMGARGRQRARQFSWTHFIERVDREIEKMVDARVTTEPVRAEEVST